MTGAEITTASVSRNWNRRDRLADLGLLALAVAIVVLAFVAFSYEGLEHSPSGRPGEPAEMNPDQILLSLGKPEHLDRGERIYQVHCQPCHGADGNLGLAGARRFGQDPFLNTTFGSGAHPVSLFDTLHNGFRQMISQSHLPVGDRIAVIRYLREQLVRERNPGEYVPLERLLEQHAKSESGR